MERESFVFYRSFYEALKFLSNEDKGKLFDVICQYGLYGNETEIEGPAMGMFLLIKPQLDANNRRYENGCKGGAPEGNSNAVKAWQNDIKQPKNNQTLTKEQPKNNQKQPNDNVNDNVNVNVNDNVRGVGEEVSTANAVSSTPTGLDVDNRKGKNDDSMKLSKAQIKQQAIDNLRRRMEEEGYSNTVVDLIMDFDEVKKGTKLHKQTEKGIKAFITTLNTRDTEQGKIDLLNTAIAGPTQGIWANKFRKPANQEVRPRVSGNMFH